MHITITRQTAQGVTDYQIDSDDRHDASVVAAALDAHAGVAPERTRSESASPAPLVHGALWNTHGADAQPALTGDGMQVHVVAGPAAGAVFRLPVGHHEIGRAGALSWNDTALSRRHISVDVTPTAVTVTDLGSANGTTLDATAVPTDHAVAWQPGQLLHMGDSLVVLRPARAAGSGAVVTASTPGWRTFVRPPRIRGSRQRPAVDIPTPPAEQAGRRFPVVAMIVPIVFGVAMALAMKAPQYLLFTLMSPLMLAANYIGDRRGNRKSHRQQAAEYATAAAKARADLDEAARAERVRAWEDNPDPALLLVEGVLPGRRLWERRRDDEDALRLRVGVGAIATTVVLSGPADEADRTLPDMPVTVDLADAGVVGVAGPAEQAAGLARWLLAQVACQHTPDDAHIVFLTAGRAAGWDWVRWLPHARSDDPGSCVARVGNDPETVAARVKEIAELIRTRTPPPGHTGRVDAASFPAVVVAVDDYPALRETPGLSGILRDGPAVGVYTVCTAEQARMLPDSTGTVIEFEPNDPAFVGLRRSGATATAHVLADQVSAAWADRLARALAPLLPAADTGGDAHLPDSARLLDVLSLEPPTADGIRARWQVQPRSTTMTLGVGADGPFRLDLKADGPHGLIAGMTGSGKTELLQSIIAALAVANRPEWLNFVLIDYKGDSAFKDCVNLPHTVGKVNDLDPFLVQRALTSLQAELDVRKNILAEAGVKDIDDYQDLQAREPDRAPLPRLLLVIDEFAELKKELPEFVDGLVSIAQLGRSLGVHMLLATQRPSGVISQNIRANTNMRLSLRVADTADSADVIQAPDAARIPKSAPGRGYARLGAGALHPFQAGRIGGRRRHAATRAETERVPEPVITPTGWATCGYPEPARPTAHAAGPVDVTDTDLAALVDAIRTAAAAEHVPPQRQPWLDPLPESCLWDAAAAPAATPGLIPPLPFGRRDVPDRQTQETTVFDLERDGHLFVAGSAHTGRSQLLRTLAAAAARTTTADDLHLYGIDCGAGALNALTALPHTGAITSRTDPDRVRRLLGRITDALDTRQALLARHGWADLAEQRRTDPDGALPRMLLLIDRWEGFTPTLGQDEAITGSIHRLLREGAAAGIHVVITGDRTLLSSPRMASMTDNKYVLRLADKTDYAQAGIPAKTVPDALPAGRCFGPDLTQTQVFLLDADPAGSAQAAAIRTLAAGIAAPEHHRPMHVDPLPARIGADEVARWESSRPPRVVIGVGGDDLAAIGPRLDRGSVFLIGGPHRSGRTTVLSQAARIAAGHGTPVIAVGPHLQHLRGMPGVTVLAADADTATLDDATAAAAADGGGVLMILDDADQYASTPADDFLTRAVGGRIPGLFLLVAGPADMGSGFTGWQVQARKARQGALLSPQGLGDGELIGARVDRALLGGPIRPGHALIHLGDGILHHATTLAPGDDR